MNDSTVGLNSDMRVSPKVVIGALLALSWALVLLSQSLVEPFKFEVLAILIAVLSIVAWVIERQNTRLGRWFIVVALAALVLLLHYWMHLSSALAWLAVPTALAAILLSLPAATGIALGEAALLILLSLGRPGSADWVAMGVAIYTLPVGLIFIQQGSYIQRGLAYAGAFIASVPVLVFYAFFQRRTIASITMTGMAGQ
jgi:hypothetical protein